MSRQTMENRQKRISWYDGLYGAIILLITTISFQLFSRMIIVYQDKYHSDIRYYVRSAADDTRPHWKRLIEFVFSKLYDISGTTFEINLYLAFVIGAIIIVNFILIRFFLRNDGIRAPRYAREFCSVAVIFTSAIYVPGFHEYFYRLSFSNFAWQSPTQQSMILFSLVATICFLKMYIDYDRGIHPGWWLATAVAVFLSAYSKPNFFMDMAVTCVVLFAIDLFFDRRLTLAKRLIRLFIMGCSLVPAGLYMIILNRMEYGTEESESRVVIGFENMFDQSHMKAGFLCGLAFALVVCGMNLKVLKDRKYRFAAGIFITGILQWLFLHEEGPSAAYGNFGWGKEYGTYFIILVSMIIALGNWYHRDEFLGGRKPLQYLYFICIGGLLMLHLASGIVYFYLVVTGHGYYI